MTHAESLAAIAARHQLPPDAVAHLDAAIRAGGGTQAQFAHPGLGGMGQWSAGGMVMIGDMFNSALKAAVDGAARELAALPAPRVPVVSAPKPAAPWWPAALGTPASAGGQGGAEYAHFPAAGRLAVRDAGAVMVFDTTGLTVFGFGQQQSPGVAGLTLSTERGTVFVTSLTRVS